MCVCVCARACAHLCCHMSRVRLFVTPRTVACQASLSMGFSMQEYWSGLPCPPPEDLPDPGTEPSSLPKAGSLPPAPPEKFTSDSCEE